MYIYVYICVCVFKHLLPVPFLIQAPESLINHIHHLPSPPLNDHQFPFGIANLVDYIHSKGLKAGLLKGAWCRKDVWVNSKCFHLSLFA